MKNDIKGPGELIGETVSGALGLYTGYKYGVDVVEYAKTIAENQDILTYLVNQHPIITEVATALCVGELYAVGGRTLGSGLDWIANYERKLEDWLDSMLLRV